MNTPLSPAEARIIDGWAPGYGSVPRSSAVAGGVVAIGLGAALLVAVWALWRSKSD